MTYDLAARPVTARDAAPVETQLPSPNAVAHRLIELGTLLEKASRDIAVLDEKWVAAKQIHEVGYSRALLTSGETSADRRKADAVLRVADDRLHMEIAEQLVRACRERIRTLRDQIETARSVGAATRAEWAATNWTQS